MCTDIRESLRQRLLLVENHTQLAKAAKISRVTLWTFVSGRKDISLTIAARLCAAMGLDLRRVARHADSDKAKARPSGKRRIVVNGGRDHDRNDAG